MPLISSAIIALVTGLATKGLDKLVETGSEKLTEDSYEWIKSLFYKNGEPKKIMKELQESPNDQEKQNIAKAIIENSIEDNPQFEKFLKEILEKMPKNESNISNSKNINTGNINSGGGNIQIGDNYGK